MKSATPISRANAGVRNYALLFFGCVLFHMAGTWSLPLIDRDEPRFAEASREMIERGDYIVPRFNNQLRLDKPPLTYWAQTASYRVFGQNDLGETPCASHVKEDTAEKKQRVVADTDIRSTDRSCGFHTGTQNSDRQI